MQSKLDRIEEARLAQAEDKDFKREIKRITADLAAISRRPLTQADYAANWDMLRQVSRRVNGK